MKEFYGLISKKMLEKPFRYDFYNYPFNKHMFSGYMLIGHNPGNRLCAEQAEEIFKSRCCPEELSKVSRKWLVKYFEPKVYWNDFVSIFDSGQKFSEDFFKRFYFTDIIKDRTRNTPEEEDLEILKKEMESVKPQHILAFGRNAFWVVKRCLEELSDCNFQVGKKRESIEIWNSIEGRAIKLCYLPHYSNRAAHCHPTKQSLLWLKKSLSSQ